MLTELQIRDFAIIEKLTLSFTPGFTVLSGETGAGKSIIIGALGLLLGDRGRADDVRSGCERALVEGTFAVGKSALLDSFLDEQGIASEGDVVILRREVQASGRGRAWINGSPVTMTSLATAGGILAAIHGQHESRALLDAGSQLEVLDSFAGSADDVRSVAALHSQLREHDRRIADVMARSAVSGKRAEELRNVVREIESARLGPGEEERLDEEAARLEHAVELAAFAESAREIIAGEDRGVLAQLVLARRNADSLARIDPAAAALRESVDSAEVLLNELARDLVDYAARIEVDPDRLEDVNNRRAEIFRVTRKHGGSVTDALGELEEARAELAVLDGGADGIAALEGERREIARLLEASSAKLSLQRRLAARKLADGVRALLPALGMPGATFSVTVEPLPAITSGGADHVAFIAGINAGQEPREIAKVASGGELSRIMLAIKSVLAQADRIPSLVFDEVDAGIGGQIALQVGDALRALARNHQVLVITHLPQIASRAHRHFIVRKNESPAGVTVTVEPVDGDERVTEIARMLSGQPSSRTGLDHARELLQNAAALA